MQTKAIANLGAATLDNERIMIKKLYHGRPGDGVISIMGPDMQ